MAVQVEPEYAPEFATITEGKTSEIEIGRMLIFPAGSIAAIDEDYTDYQWYTQLNS